VSRLQALQERRAWECRLTPDRALQSLDEAEAFLRDRGLLTRTPDCYLPSLFEACHEEPYKPGSRGFGSWPRTKYVWSFELSARPGVYTVQVHRGKTLYISGGTAALLDPVCRAELARMEADARYAWLLRHLADAGPSEVGDLRTELELSARELKALRATLERCGVIVSSGLVIERPEGHVHGAQLARWDQVFPEPAQNGGGIEAVVVAGVRAAVVAPEPDVRKWFSWPIDVDRLVADGRLDRPERGWVALGM
jgi:hypothetical protein